MQLPIATQAAHKTAARSATEYPDEIIGLRCENSSASTTLFSRGVNSLNPG